MEVNDQLYLRSKNPDACLIGGRVGPSVRLNSVAKRK